jgi:hypothetical protein
MKDYLTDRIKFREGFRPYAPAVLREHAPEYFEFEGESPFMLLVAKVREEKRIQIPAVTHVDGTARLQTVSEKTNSRLYQLIRCFYDETGIPIVLNTSLNIKGQPIVETPGDAIECFFKSEMDFLVLGNYLISKDLLQDDELRHLRPKSLVRPERDLKNPPHYFLYDQGEQKVVSISDIQFQILTYARGDCDLETLGNQIKRDFSDISGEARKLLRNNWLTLGLPHQEIIKGGKA